MIGFRILLFLLPLNLLLGVEIQDALTRSLGFKTLVFSDKVRQRILITEVIYPAENETRDSLTSTDIFNRAREARDAPLLKSQKKYPLILFSHGYKGDRFGHAWLEEILASYGYIVASLDHFGETWYMFNPEKAIQRWNRPLDITFVLNELLKDPLFGSHIDQDKIGFVGYALGGLTGLWLAGGIANQYMAMNEKSPEYLELDGLDESDASSAAELALAKKSYHDPRIKAMVLLAPSKSLAFDIQGLSQIKIPLLLIAAENDEIAEFKSNARYLKNSIQSSELVAIPGKAGHYIFLNPKGEVGRKSLPAYLTEDDPSVNRREIHKDIAKATLQFFYRTLVDSPSRTEGPPSIKQNK
jgi:predicted dienelactone hydrolase